jgi:hypothetical protein
MVITKYLVISATQRNSYSSLTPHMKIVEKVPTLKGNEISLRLNINIPDAVFKRPKLEADFKVPEQAVQKLTITPDMVTNMEKIVKENIGMDVKISVIEHPEEAKQETK